MKTRFIALLLALLLVTASWSAWASPPPPDLEDDPDDQDLDDNDDDDDISGPPADRATFRRYLPRDPRLLGLHRQAMGLAVENARLIAQRGVLQPEMARLEMEEGRLRYRLLKLRIDYYRIREKLVENPDSKIKAMLKSHDNQIRLIDELVRREEKIDCYHTIFEKKHRAMEEYHWSLLDDKHSLIGEYLQGMDYDKSKDQFEILYNEVITDYRQIISGNRLILEETQRIIPEKQKRIDLLGEAVEAMEALMREMPGCDDQTGE